MNRYLNGVYHFAKSFRPLVASIGLSLFLILSGQDSDRRRQTVSFPQYEASRIASSYEEGYLKPRIILETVDSSKPKTSTPTENIRTPARLQSVVQTNGKSRVTYFYCEQEEGYPKGDGGGFCGTFANGEKVTPEHSGRVAACGYKWLLGTRLLIDEKHVLECVDRGHLSYDQVDVFTYTNGEFHRSDFLALGGYAKVSAIN